MLDFLRSERAGEDVALPVGEPFLEDLVAAEFVAPDSGGDVAPPGASVQVDVEGGLAADGACVVEGGPFWKLLFEMSMPMMLTLFMDAPLIP